MNKVLKGLVAVAATAAMAVAGFAGASTAMAAEGTHTVTITPAKSDHTYEAYQIFTGNLGADGSLGQDAALSLAMSYGVLALTRASLLMKAPIL